MEFRTLEKPGVKTSLLGFGCMRFPTADGKIDEARAEKMLDDAYAAGINYFDTAWPYHNGESEPFVGKAMNKYPRDSFFFATKLPCWNVKEREDGVKIFHQQLDHLQTDYIDFYHMWCMLNLDSWEKHMEALYRFFEEAKSEGLIRNIVFSSHMQGNDIETVVDTGKFQGMLIGYNALNYRFRQSGIEAAHANGMGVVVMNPLGGGMIPENPEVFQYLTEGTDLTVPQAALRFVASHKEITITLAGCTTKEHIDDAVKAVENLEEMPAKEVVKKYESKGISLNNLCTGCGYCVKGCPKGIAIPKFMDSYNQYILTNNKAEISDRLKMHWSLKKTLAGECIACGKCEKACTQHLPIIERLREISAL